MKKIIMNLVICILHMLGVLYVESNLWGSVAFYYAYSFTSVFIITICAIIGLLAHYLLIMHLSKLQLLGRRTPLILLVFDCVASCYMIIPLAIVSSIDSIVNEPGRYICIVAISICIVTVGVYIHKKTKGQGQRDGSTPSEL